MSKTWRFCSSFKNVCLQAWDTWKISAKMHFWQARDNRCSSEMLGGQGADFVRGVAFWSIRSSSLVKSFSVWPGILFSWQAQYFRQMEWKNHKAHWYEAVSFALNCLFLKEVSQNWFVFDVINFEYERKSRRSRRIVSFWRQVGKEWKSSRMSSFLTLSTSSSEGASQTCFGFKLN